MIKLLECEEYHPNSVQFGAHVKHMFLCGTDDAVLRVT